MLTLLKFYADWCGPCKAMTPVVEQLDAEDDNLIVTNINIDDNPQVRADYHIRSIPAFVLLKDRQEVARRTGSATLTELKKWVDESRGL